MVNFQFTLPDHVGMAANLKKGKGKRWQAVLLLAPHTGFISTTLFLFGLPPQL